MSDPRHVHEIQIDMDLKNQEACDNLAQISVTIAKRYTSTQEEMVELIAELSKLVKIAMLAGAMASASGEFNRAVGQKDK